MKKFLWIVLLLILIIGVVAAIVLLTGDKETPEEELYAQEKTMFSLQTKEELNKRIKQYSLNLDQEENIYIAYNATCFGETGQYMYTFDAQGTVVTASAYVVLFGFQDDDQEKPVEFTAEQLKERLYTVLEGICAINGTELNDSFFVFSEAGMLANDQIQTYEKLKNGEASLEFTLRDKDGFFWSVKRMPTDSPFILLVEKFYDSAAYAHMIPNIEVS